jgi:hypothetical protein
MAAKHKRARLTPVLFVIGMALAMLAALWKAAEATRQAALLAQLQQADDSQASLLLRRAMHDSASGSQLCVVALQSRRQAVVAAAQEVLFEEIARWELLGDAEAIQRRQQLARQLADCVESLSQRGRIAAREIAMSLLSMPAASSAIEQGALTRACEQVLRANLDRGSVQRPESTIAQMPAGRVNTAAWLAEPEARTVQASDTSQTVTRDSHGVARPGAMLPLDEMNQQDTFSSDSGPPDPASRSSDVAAPQLLSGDMSHALPIEQYQEQAQPLPVAQEQPSADQPARLLDEPPARPLLSTNEHDLESRLETMRLVERLHGDEATAQHARRELARRGFTATELEIASRLTDPHPATRLRWLEALPGLPEIDARPWLLWLSRDASADIRLAALSIMATSGEPEMMRRVAQMAREEIDPRVQQQALEIQQRLDSSRRKR